MKDKIEKNVIWDVKNALFAILVHFNIFDI